MATVRTPAQHHAKNAPSHHAVEDRVLELQVLEVAAHEVDALASQSKGLDLRAGAFEQLDFGPPALIEVDSVQPALHQATTAECASPEFGAIEDTVDESAAGDGDAAEIAGIEDTVGEPAGRPLRLAKSRGCEPAANKHGIGEPGQIEVETDIGRGVRLPSQGGRSATRAFAPEVVVEDDFLRTHYGLFIRDFAGEEATRCARAELWESEHSRLPGKPRCSTATSRAVRPPSTRHSPLDTSGIFEVSSVPAGNWILCFAIFWREGSNPSQVDVIPSSDSPTIISERLHYQYQTI